MREKVYCNPNHQSSELAKALISFSNPGFIRRHNASAIEYLKLYGGNAFGNKLNKKSFKVEWFNKNEHNIINFENVTF